MFGGRAIYRLKEARVTDREGTARTAKVICTYATSLTEALRKLWLTWLLLIWQ